MSTFSGSCGNFKVLCMHGIGTNSEILETQTAALRKRLGSTFEWDFIEGAHPWPAADKIFEIFGEDQICYSYFDGTASSAKTAIDDLAAYIIQNGPFDAILGFSLGAAMAATLLLSPEHEQIQGWVRSVVFLCATLPCDWNSLENGMVRPLRSAGVDELQKIRIPSVHVWSLHDVDYPGQSGEVYQMCTSKNRVGIVHTSGHRIPFHGNDTAAVAGAIFEMVAKLKSAGE